MNKVDLKIRKEGQRRCKQSELYLQVYTSTCKKIIPNVKQLLSKRTKHSQWNFDIKVDLMIGSAEDVHESVEKHKLKRNISGITLFV